VAPNSGVPIYRQVVDQVRQQIAGGHLAANEFLPSVRPGLPIICKSTR